MKILQVILMILGPILLLGTVYAQDDSEKEVYRMSRSGDGKVIAVSYAYCGGVCSTIDVFDGQTGAFIETIDLAPLHLSIIALDMTGDRIAYSTEYEIGYYDRTTDTQTYLNFAGGTSWLAWDPLNTNLLALTLGSVLLVVDPVDNDTVTSMRTDGLISRVEWSPDGQYLASRQTDNVINIWSRSDFNATASLDIPTLAIEPSGPMYWHPDSTQLVMIKDPGFVIYDLTNSEIIREVIYDDDETPYVVKWSPDGSKIAAGGDMLRVWDSTTWEVIEENTYDNFIVNLEWSFDGEHIFHDGGDKGLYWDDVPVSELVPEPEVTESP